MLIAGKNSRFINIIFLRGATYMDVVVFKMCLYATAESKILDDDDDDILFMLSNNI